MPGKARIDAPGALHHIIARGIKGGRSSKRFDALDWLAQLTTHIPNRREHMVRSYGYYSNKSRAIRKKAEADDSVSGLTASAYVLYSPVQHQIQDILYFAKQANALWIYKSIC